MIPIVLAVALAQYSLAQPDEPVLLQDVMEVFIENFEGNDVFQNAYGEYLDISGWEGLRVVAGTLKRIRWNKRGFRGLFHFAILPQSVETIVIPQNEFTGEIAHLPNALQFFSCEENYFHGTIDWSALPKSLTFFDARQNKLSGEVDLRNVPHSLENIYIRRNELRIINIDALDAWRGGGDIYSQISASKKAKTPNVRKSIGSEVRPVSNSAPYVSQKIFEKDAKNKREHITQYDALQKVVFPSPSFEDQFSNKNEGLKDEAISLGSEANHIANPMPIPETANHKTSWLTRILQLLVYTLGIFGFIVFYNVSNFI